uniref:Peptidylprolyl isomerase n=1 Tax=Schistocephalus solidus TaxID=70667 RepID=A0A183SHG6_SCHSO
LSNAEVGAAAGDLVYVYYVRDLAPKPEYQDVKQQEVERLTSHMCEIARGHFKKEQSQPDAQTASILHLPQPLLYKAVTSVEVCLVCSGRAIDVGFVQLTLLNELSIDSCVIVIEPVLVLTMCAAEDIQGGVLDGVPQLSPAVLHGDARVSDWKVA